MGIVRAMITHAQQFQEALQKSYVAAMFDIDGTLTEMGQQEIPFQLRQTLVSVSAHIPVALCSGRKVEGILKKLEEILEAAPEEKRERLRAQWTFFLENGAIGVRYNPSTKTHERFYEFLWPEKKMAQKKVAALLEQSMPTIDPCEIRMNECNVGVYPLKRATYTPEYLAAITAEMATQMRQQLRTWPYANDFHVIDSGVAVHVMQTFPDKDFAIEQFGQWLRKERGLSIGLKAREILVVGDQPGPGFNDEKFLEGKWGTPFTVGTHLLAQTEYPIPVFSEDQGLSQRLVGPEATQHLLQRVFLLSNR